MTTKLKGAKGWTEAYGDHEYTKSFGPIKATVSREWPHNERRPTEYRAVLTVHNTGWNCIAGSVAIAELGVDYFEDAADAVACKMLEKKIKAVIRSWTR